MGSVVSKHASAHLVSPGARTFGCPPRSKKQGQNTTNRRPPSANPSLRPGSALSRPMSAATLRPMSASSRIEILRPSSAYRCPVKRLPCSLSVFVFTLVPPLGFHSLPSCVNVGRQPNCLLERMPSRFTIFDRDHAGLIDHGKIISHRKPRPGSATAVNARIKSVYANRSHLSSES